MTVTIQGEQHLPARKCHARQGRCILPLVALQQNNPDVKVLGQKFFADVPIAILRVAITYENDL
jgi:hypothetical protein